MGTPLLQISQLHAGYGKAEVLHGLNLHAERGSVITVIGPNGAGKTTLTHLLSGDVPATNGELWLRGQNVSGWPHHRRRARHQPRRLAGGA